MLTVLPAPSAPGQNAPSSEAPQAQVVLKKLAPPVYPIAAWQARVMGIVKVGLGIRRDGSLASSSIVSGHALLAQAALESMRSSEFQCSDCSTEGAEYMLTFEFEFQDSKECPTEAPGKPTVTILRDVVTVAVPQKCEILVTGDPPSTFKKRSAKCLYLWLCGRR